MLPETVALQLKQAGITAEGEVGLREALERHIETYTLIRLAPRAARRWKCHYRLMMGADVYDAQSASEAYALGILAIVQQKEKLQESVGKTIL
jgi:hypothetical protein